MLRLLDTIRIVNDMATMESRNVPRLAKVLAQMPFTISFGSNTSLPLIGRVFDAVQHVKGRSGSSASKVGRSVEIWTSRHHLSASLRIEVHLSFISGATWNCPGLTGWKSSIRIMSRGRIGRLGCASRIAISCASRITISCASRITVRCRSRIAIGCPA